MENLKTLKPEDYPTSSNYCYCVELHLRPGVAVAVVAPNLNALDAMVKIVGGRFAKLEIDAVQTVTIALKELHA
jgi:hypothetical protein